MSSTSKINKILANRFFQHSIFWGFFIVMEIGHYMERGDDVSAYMFFGKYFTRLIAAAIIIYINLEILIPRLLNRDKRLWYFIAIIFLILGMAHPSSQIVASHFNVKLLPDGKHPGPWFAQTHYFVSVIMSSFLVILTSLLHFTKAWVKLKDVEIELKEVARGKLEVELKALKAQVNPHFLFNTLNNIYALSLDKSSKTPETILKLSDLMSYMIYDSSADTVDIHDEMEFLKNYIALEKIRVDEDVDVSFDFDDNMVGIKVAPLLFIPFIENAFKHCPKSGDPMPSINISLKAVDEQLQFKLCNTLSDEVIDVDPKHSGIGIENVKKRLALLYPNRYNLSIDTANHEFKVSLKIETDHE